MNYKSYIIHLNQDVGRFKAIKEFKKKCSGKIYYGENSFNIKNNVLLQKKDRNKATLCLKKTFTNLVKECLENKLDYVFTFDDSVVRRKDFSEQFDKLNKTIKTLENWKLIYLGTNTPISFKNNNFLCMLKDCETNNLILNGSFGFALHNSAFKIVVERDLIEELTYSPFDISCLGYLQIKYFDQCYITNPFLVIQDVSTSNIRGHRNLEMFSKYAKWECDNYVFYKSKPMYILIKDNILKTEQVLEFSNLFYPVYKPILIHLNTPKDTMTAYLKLKKAKGGIEYYVVTSTSKLYQIIMDDAEERCADHYIITNFYINWTLTSDNINKQIEKSFTKDVDVLNIKISKCPHCISNEISCFMASEEKNKIDTHLDLISGFSVVKNGVDLAFDLRCKKMEFTSRILYKNSLCRNKNYGYHFPTLDDIKTVVDVNILSKDNYWYNLLEYDCSMNSQILKDLQFFSRNIFYSKIDKFLKKNNIDIDLKKTSNEEIKISKSEIDKFSDQNIKQLNISYKKNQNNIIFIFKYCTLFSSRDYNLNQRHKIKEFMVGYLKDLNIEPSVDIMNVVFI